MIDIINSNEDLGFCRSYDTNDNLIEITGSQGNVFGYDSLNRKVSMDDPDLGVWIYKYDQNGNLILQSGGGGNLVSGDGYYREYDGNGHLLKVRQGNVSTSALLEEYLYDQDGQRIKIKRNDSANTIVYTPFKELMRIVNTTGTYDFTYIYQDGTLVARKNPDGTTHYYHDDHLGSVSVLTNGTGSVLENTYYSPYGEELGGGDKEVRGYTGQFDDEATGQMYYGARYYKPAIALIIQGDTQLPNVHDPQQLNRYSYARNNPYAFSDDSGHRITYQVENYGGGEQISIYQDDAYIGRVTSEAVTTNVYPSYFDHGQNVDVTTYDYAVQPGSKTLGTDGVPTISEYGKEKSLPSIVAQDQKRLLRQENLEWGHAIGSDALDLLLIGSSKVPKALKNLQDINTGYSLITSEGWLNRALSLVPLTATAQTYFNQDKGYQPYQKIPEFKGYSKSESNLLAGGGVIRRGSSSSFVLNGGNKNVLVRLTRIR